MSIILGLDISTSNTGVSIINGDCEILKLDAIQLSKCKTFWEKVDKVDVYLKDLSQQFTIDSIAVEAALLGFSSGASSMSTISMLLKFNGIVQLLCRQRFNVDPIAIPSATARKLCGIKFQQKKICGKGHKEQTFNWIMSHDLINHPFPLKKSGKIVDWATDAIDAYVIAKASIKMNT